MTHVQNFPEQTYLLKVVKNRYYLPLENGAALHLNKVESQGCWMSV